MFESVASIGMFTLESLRSKGIGTSILLGLNDECARLGIHPIAGCWYYNQLSKKTLEKAGMFSPTRLLKISF